MTIVFDNNRLNPRLKASWGFACISEVGSTLILFDTGSDGATLLNNMKTLDIEPSSIDMVVISHNHWDHIGGMMEVLNAHPAVRVCIPASFPPNVKEHIAARGTALVEIDEHQEIAPGVHSLGDMGDRIHEQAMAILTDKGLILVTGCAHPGILNILKTAGDIFPKKSIFLVLGGFHLRDASDFTLKQHVGAFEAMGIEHLAPCHCTGERALDLFGQAFGDRFIHTGVGGNITIQPSKGT